MAFVILNSIHQENIQRKKTALENRMYDAFHGNDEKELASQSDLFLCGEGIYSHLFNKETSSSGATPSGGDKSLEIHSYLSCRPEEKVKVGKILTKDVLTLSTLPSEKRGKAKGGKAKDDKKITGKTLYGIATEAHRNCKKALAIADEYLIKGQAPSGTNEKDYLDHILQEMFKLLVIKPAQDQDHNTEPNTQEKPDDWFFKGFWAFYIYGPYPIHEMNTLLALTDITDMFENKTDAGRQAGRKRAKNDAAKERAANISNPNSQSPFKRGITIQDRMNAASMAQLADHHKLNKFSEMISALQ